MRKLKYTHKWSLYANIDFLLFSSSFFFFFVCVCVCDGGGFVGNPRRALPFGDVQATQEYVAHTMLRAHAHLPSFCSEFPCKLLACVIENLLGRCRARFSNLVSESRPFYFLWRVAMLSVSIASQRWASKWRPKSLETRRHRNWVSLYRVTPVSGNHGCPIILIETKPERDIWK